MKLLTYDTGNGPRCGVLQEDRVVDVSALIGADRTLRDVQALLESDSQAVQRVGEALARSAGAPGVPLANVRLRSPLLRPPTIRDFMIFEEHATQQGTREREEAWYRMPIFYFSNPLCVYGPDDTIPFPSASEMLDYELELACIVGKEASNVAEADALDYIAGFCIFNDWSCRDLQRDESAVGLGPAKGKDSASSLGPWIVTTDELAPLIKGGRLNVKCSCRVNGDYWVKDSDASVSYHTWGSLIERASHDSRIAPGTCWDAARWAAVPLAKPSAREFRKRVSCSRAIWWRWTWKRWECCGQLSGPSRKPTRTIATLQKISPRCPSGGPSRVTGTNSSCGRTSEPPFS